ncbi:MAG TPA: hypothetical protein VF629_02965 [Hymenobacter sp.]|jgi:hypothetical protein|uniref:hypothetical protein n=1 Tax=Hymenobacter sp. TaxID=1898978 RepID=UPI002EDAA4E8
MATTAKKELEISLSITPAEGTPRTEKHHLPTVADAHQLLTTTLQAAGWQGQRVPAHSVTAIQRALAAVHYYALDTAGSGSGISRVVALVRWVDAATDRPQPGANQMETPAMPLTTGRHAYRFNDPFRKRLGAYQEGDGRFFLVNGHGSGLGAPWGLGPGIGSAHGYYDGIEELQAALDAHHTQGGWAQWAVQVARNEWEVMTAGVRAWWEAGSHGATELKADLAVESAHQALDELCRVADFVKTQGVYRALLKLLQVRFYSGPAVPGDVASVTEDVRRAVFYAYSDACEGRVSPGARSLLEQRFEEAKGLAIAAGQATCTVRHWARAGEVNAPALDV